VKVPKILRGAPAADEATRRRRRRARADGPSTIVPIVDGDATPSWLQQARKAAAPMALDLDAARDRLRREIPPVDDGRP
jgi:hypothetical protein